jgi:tRNA threonylcarbamoyl adenosine modification protein (Sua5/YciO/YrdC/YwlC family)
MAEIIRVDPESPGRDEIERAAGLIRRGEVIAIPTDTVYGLAADPFNLAAVQKVFSAKGRPGAAPLLLLIDSLELATRCASSLPPLFGLLAKKFWPGPLTLVVPASSQLPAAVTGGTSMVGLRLPDAAVPLALVRAVGGPITGTSANVSGRGDCRSAKEVEHSLGSRLSLILDGGESRVTQTSTVLRIDGEQWGMIREGAIAAGEIEKFLLSQKRKQRPKPLF